ncbi:MAG: chemotaxis protein CheX [Candidatus Krumholzibacteriia bacterium]
MRTGIAAQRCMPAEVLREAVASVVDTCEIQTGLRFEVESGLPDLRETDVAVGSNVALSSERGAWNLAVMADRPSAAHLARILLAMGDDEEPAVEDLADALGEIASVAGGVMKSRRLQAAGRVQIGLPLFMEGRRCLEFIASGVPGLVRSLAGPGALRVHVILIWQAGDRS